MRLSALIIGATGALLTLYFVVFLHHRGKALVYTIMLILFTGFCSAALAGANRPAPPPEPKPKYGPPQS